MPPTGAIGGPSALRRFPSRSRVGTLTRSQLLRWDVTEDISFLAQVLADCGPCSSHSWTTPSVHDGVGCEDSAQGGDRS